MHAGEHALGHMDIIPCSRDSDTWPSDLDTKVTIGKELTDRSHLMACPARSGVSKDEDFTVKVPRVECRNQGTGPGFRHLEATRVDVRLA